MRPGGLKVARLHPVAEGCPPSRRRGAGLIGRIDDGITVALVRQPVEAVMQRTCYPTPPASTGSSAADSSAIDPGTPYRRRPVCDDCAVRSCASGAVHAAGADDSISFRYEGNEYAQKRRGGCGSDHCHTNHHVSSCVKRQLSAHKRHLITRRPSSPIDLYQPVSATVGSGPAHGVLSSGAPVRRNARA
jgi:hypothetical protein